MRYQSVFSRRRAAFTLIELLTVIAVIGVLAAIIIPVTSKVRVGAQRTASASNLRQWGIATLLHSQETRGRLPWEVVSSSSDTPSWTEVDNPLHANCWFNALPPYVGQQPLSAVSTDDRNRDNRSPAYLTKGSIFYSPGARTEEYRAGRANATKPTFCYMMNSQIYSNAAPAGMRNDPRGLLISALPQGARHSRVALMTENMQNAYEERPKNGPDYTANRAKGDGRSVSARFNTRTNVSFLDGSVRTFASDYLAEELGGIYPRADKPDVAWAVWEYPW
jgi:prepilin-type N-terminal cleavage/methylation domain-containing protein/prepilin-type processing-associated H-X9-DG protein